MMTRSGYILFLLLAYPIVSVSQFVQFSLIVEPELTINTQTELDFGQLNFEGISEIGLDDARVGILNIYGLVNSMIGLRIITPDYLIHSEYNNCDEDWCRIDVDLMYAYTFQGIFDTGRRSVASIPNTSGNLQLYVPLRQRSTDPIGLQYAQLTLFVYGQAETRQAISGSYFGEVQLVVLYE
jgi:hypothetical protein